MSDLAAAERQVRDYNRNNTADISVLTDGQKWRLYLPSASGEFANKCFATFELLGAEGAMDDAQGTLQKFLSKTALESGLAVEEARACLKRTDAERTMFEVLPLARTDVDLEPSTSMVAHFMRRCRERGVTCDEQKAVQFIRGAASRVVDSISAPEAHVPKRSAASVSATPGYPNPTPPMRVDARQQLMLVGKRGTHALGHNLSQGGFRDLKGSLAALPTAGFEGKSRDIAEQLVGRGILAADSSSGLLKLTSDCDFKSSSAASSASLGCSASGPREWKPQP